MEIHFYPMPSWMPHGMFKELLFSFHSPNTLLDIDCENYQSLSTDKIHEIYYNQIHTELLSDGYDTNCFNYDLDYKYVNFNMRSDCIGDCFIKALRKRYNFTDFPTYNKLLRWELLRNNPNMTINDIRYDMGLKTRAQ